MQAHRAAEAKRLARQIKAGTSPIVPTLRVLPQIPTQRRVSVKPVSYSCSGSALDATMTLSPHGLTAPADEREKLANLTKLFERLCVAGCLATSRTAQALIYCIERKDTEGFNRLEAYFLKLMGMLALVEGKATENLGAGLPAFPSVQVAQAVPPEGAVPSKILVP